MQAIQQRCRPKHQVLVLKCYPRTTKGAVDVKPNSSELSYLLFYATSRRSKIQKIGSFLEKKTASDVWRLRIGNVQVTLGILTALIEKTPKDLPLFASNVLKILELIMGSNDITMAQSSIPTFEAFCENHDVSSSFAEQGYLAQYEAIVHSYANLASTRHSQSKRNLSKPVMTRWRSVGLEAIKSVSSSDPLSSMAGRQYSVIVPIILENLCWEDANFLDTLLSRVQMAEKIESDRLMKRRASVGTTRTNETNPDTNPLALAGTTDDVDKLAEEDIGVLALQCLKQTFVVPNQPQIRAATTAILNFVQERVAQGERMVDTDLRTGEESGWAIKIFALVARWAPVQDRYIILVTAMDHIRRTLIADDNLQEHLVLITMVGSLLRSDVNLIGLSVMDVLLELVQHIKKLLQAPVAPSKTDDGEKADRSPSTSQAFESEGTARRELLDRIQRCIGDLSTHVYYADQISDMISAILLRLRPSRSSSTHSSPHGEKAEPSAQDDVTSSQANLDSYLSFSVGKTAALKAVKSILLIANPQTKMSGNITLSRNRVPLHVWEGTNWILRDPDRHVRRAYADALLTWLDRETIEADSQAKEDPWPSHPRSSLRSHRDGSPANPAHRAVSSASNRDKTMKHHRSHFLQLLHVSIYDNALQYVDSEADIVMLHVLLAKLVFRLGVNAVRYGLPMVFRLQEDIQDADTPTQKVRLGTLCHGYFWAVVERFEIDTTSVGRAVQNEIVRRRSKQFWVEGVNVPAPSLDQVGSPSLTQFASEMSVEELETEALLPFDDRESMVESIEGSYVHSVTSPPLSPAASPGRSFTQPILGSTLSSAPTGLSGGDSEKELPDSFRDLMLTDWTREAAMIAIQAGSRSESMTASRSGTTGTAAKRIPLNGGANGNSNGNGRPRLPSSPLGSQQNLRPTTAAVGGGLAPPGKMRKTSVRSGASGTASQSSRGPVTSVQRLKAVLSGELPGTALGTSAGMRPGDGRDSDDSGSDSMVSFDYSPSELSFNPAASQQQPSQQTQFDRPGHDHGDGDGGGVGEVSGEGAIAPSLRRSGSHGSRGGPLNSNPPDASSPVHQDLGLATKAKDEDGVPPVPPLPETRGFSSSRSGGLQQPNDLPRPVSSHDHALKPAGRDISSRSGESRRRAQGARPPSRGSFEPSESMDLRELLQGIDSRAGEGSLGNVTKPPY